MLPNIFYGCVKGNGRGAGCRRGSMAAALIAAMACAAGTAADAAIQIQLGGVDIAYDGSSVTDINTSGADPLTNATLTDLTGNTVIGSVTTGVTLDLSIPGVLNIPISGGVVPSTPGGTFELSFGGGDYLSLTMNSATITYQPVVAGPFTFNFVFAGAVASINGQQLPFSTSIGDPVSITFSMQAVPGTVSDDGTYLTGFVAAGTGEIDSASFTYVPEPATMALLMLGGMMMGMPRRRNR